MELSGEGLRIITKDHNKNGESVATKIQRALLGKTYLKSSSTFRLASWSLFIDASHYFWTNLSK